MTVRQLLNAYSTPDSELLSPVILDMDLGKNVYNGKHEEVRDFFVACIDRAREQVPAQPSDLVSCA